MNTQYELYELKKSVYKEEYLPANHCEHESEVNFSVKSTGNSTLVVLLKFLCRNVATQVYQKEMYIHIEKSIM